MIYHGAMKQQRIDMTERPIVFSAPMVRAILGGVKTQTRRAMRHQPQPWGTLGGLQLPGYCASTEECFRRGAPIFMSPYGRPGDRLWGKETFQQFTDDGEVLYRADPKDAEAMNELKHDGCLEARWRPSTQMPRRLSRILLEVLSVRVERLQGISEADCWAEGIDQVMHQFSNASQFKMARRLGLPIEDAKPLYAQLWESIHGPGSWDVNRWLWVVEFKRIEVGHD